jgi:hypothetical protein
VLRIERPKSEVAGTAQHGQQGTDGLLGEFVEASRVNDDRRGFACWLRDEREAFVDRNAARRSVSFLESEECRRGVELGCDELGSIVRGEE